MTLLKSHIKPLGNKVLIQRSEAVKSKGGILLPDSAQEKPRHGVVIAVGPGKYDDQGKKIPMTIHVGQKVLYSSYAALALPSDQQEELLLVSEDDILAILN